MIKPTPDDAARVPATTVTQTVLDDRAHGSRVALIEATSGRALSYAELARAVRSAASGMTRAGLGPRDVVGVHLPDVPEIAIALYAVMAAGAAPTPIRPTTSVEAMRRQLTETGARWVITWPVLLDIALAAVRDTRVERVVCFGAEPDAEPFSALLAGAGRPVGAGLDPRTDTALVPYTRGTTGPPKGVRLTHRNLVAGILRLVGAGLISGTDTVLSTIPLTDVAGQVTALHVGLHAGAAVVTRSGTGRLDLLRTMQDRRVSFLLCTPDIVAALAADREVARYNLRSLRSIISTGGALRPEAARACAARLGCPVRPAYGLAEAAGITHVNPRAAEEGTLDSVGRGLPWVDWRIVDSRTGAEQPAYQAGELLIRGPAVARSRASAEPLPEWARTGDSAFVDEHGRLYIIGRMSGPDVPPPDDPQAMLEAHPAVRDAAVISIPDRDLGLFPHAFAVLRRPAAGTDLLTYLNGQLPLLRQVRAVHLVPVIPRTPSGRIMRRVLIERAGLAAERNERNGRTERSEARRPWGA
jgi:acyl-CoA synthetase (AMP-forming)/AMP-acid ligase II